MAAEECPICYEPITKRVKIACGHEFCFACLKHMQARKQHTCPMCRADSPLIANLKTRCPRKGKDGVAVVRVNAPPRKKRRVAPPLSVTNTIVLSDDASDEDYIPRARCTYCDELYDLNYLQLHSTCPSHLLCAACAYIPRALGLDGSCIVCTMHELNLERDGLNELLTNIQAETAVS
jgi:Ring finger domain